MQDSNLFHYKKKLHGKLFYYKKNQHSRCRWGKPLSDTASAKSANCFLLVQHSATRNATRAADKGGNCVPSSERHVAAGALSSSEEEKNVTLGWRAVIWSRFYLQISRRFDSYFGWDAGERKAMPHGKTAI